MTTFSEINQLMLQNGWERIIKIKDYEKLKRENKEVTARIGTGYFYKLKQENRELKMRKELINEIKLDLTMKINKYGLDFCYQKFLEHLDKLVEVREC